VFVTDLTDESKVKVVISKCGNEEIVNLVEFTFDWMNEVEIEIFKLSIKKSGQILGLMSFIRIFEELRIEIRLLELNKINVVRNKRYDRIAGILIAFACKEAFFSGFFGFVSLIPKTRLIDHYISKYGFKQFGRHLAVELKTSERLMNKYLLDE